MLRDLKQKASLTVSTGKTRIGILPVDGAKTLDVFHPGEIENVADGVRVSQDHD